MRTRHVFNLSHLVNSGAAWVRMGGETNSYVCYILKKRCWLSHWTLGLEVCTIDKNWNIVRIQVYFTPWGCKWVGVSGVRPRAEPIFKGNVRMVVGMVQYQGGCWWCGRGSTMKGAKSLARLEQVKLVHRGSARLGVMCPLSIKTSPREPGWVASAVYSLIVVTRW